MDTEQAIDMINKKEDVARQILNNLIRRWKVARRLCNTAKKTYPEIIWVGYSLTEQEAWNSLQEAKKIYYDET